MIRNDKLAIAGEHAFFFSGLAGQLEAILTVPPEANRQIIALLGHPHSLQGGTMNNKVVTTMARAFKELAIPSIRFNFRGVGQSQGSYDGGIGESEDMLALMHLCQQQFDFSDFVFAGFSFGSYVAYRAAAQSAAALLITVAPPVHHYDYQGFSKPPEPWIVLQGMEDEVVPFATVQKFTEQFAPALPLFPFTETSHFFHGKLVALKEVLVNTVNTLVLKP